MLGGGGYRGTIRPRLQILGTKQRVLNQESAGERKIHICFVLIGPACKPTLVAERTIFLQCLFLGFILKMNVLWLFGILPANI